MKPDEVFDNLPTIIGRKPRTLADFAQNTRINSGTKTRNFHEHCQQGKYPKLSRANATSAKG
jgi:hypothetical protein